MSCKRPFSRSSKSSFFNPWTRCPWRSVITARSSTNTVFSSTTQSLSAFFFWSCAALLKLVDKTSTLLRKRQTTSFIAYLRTMQKLKRSTSTKTVRRRGECRHPCLPLLEQRRTGGMHALPGTLNHAGVLSVNDPSPYSMRHHHKTIDDAPGQA